MRKHLSFLRLRTRLKCYFRAISYSWNEKKKCAFFMLFMITSSTQLIRPRKSSELRYHFSFSGIVNTTRNALGYVFKISRGKLSGNQSCA